MKTFWLILHYILLFYNSYITIKVVQFQVQFLET